MDILIITPAADGSLHGNRVTAVRWAKILTDLGHSVSIQQRYQKQRADALIALHAWRSAASISSFAHHQPNKPLLVALTGTDINYYLDAEPEITLQSLQQAQYLITLHNAAAQQLPQPFASKCITIYQSSSINKRRQPAKYHFNVALAGHLRTEKDPFRCAIAARMLPSNSTVKINHYGYAHTPDWAQQARLHSSRSWRYHWYGGIKQQRWHDKLINSDLLVLSSLNEGGANVISESLAADCPIVASYIPGNVGLLGEHYPGYFRAGDTRQLSRLLYQAETSSRFYRKLQLACKRIKTQYSVHREQHAWSQLLSKLN